MEVLALGKEITELTVDQLGVLLVWHTDEPKTKLGKKPKRLRKWTKLVHDNLPPPTLVQWKPQDETELQRWKKKDIKIGETMFGRLVATKKRELDAAQDHYTREEWDTVRAKFAAMDNAELAAGTVPAADHGTVLAADHAQLAMGPAFLIDAAAMLAADPAEFATSLATNDDNDGQQDAI